MTEDGSLKLRSGRVRGMYSSVILTAACAGLTISAVGEAQARGPGGGGFRGGGFSGLRQGGGPQRQFGTNARQRPSQATQRFGSAGQTSRSANANSASVNRGNGNSAAVARGNGNSGTVNRGSGNGNGSGNRAAVNNGNINSGNLNNGDINVGNDVDVAVGNGGWAGPYAYPAGTGAAYATGVAVGTTATAAAVGSAYYALPSGCSPYAWNGYRYYTCGSTWYRQTYTNGTTAYVVVADPR